MMIYMDAKIPCLKTGQKVIKNLKQKFELSKGDMKGDLSYNECMGIIEQLIEKSWDNWRTKTYGFYQKVTNGIS